MSWISVRKKVKRARKKEKKKPPPLSLTRIALDQPAHFPDPQRESRVLEGPLHLAPLEKPQIPSVARRRAVGLDGGQRREGRGERRGGGRGRGAPRADPLAEGGRRRPRLFERAGDDGLLPRGGAAGSDVLHEEVRGAHGRGPGRRRRRRCRCSAAAFPSPPLRPEALAVESERRQDDFLASSSCCCSRCSFERDPRAPLERRRLVQRERGAVVEHDGERRRQRDQERPAVGVVHDCGRVKVTVFRRGEREADVAVGRVGAEDVRGLFFGVFIFSRSRFFSFSFFEIDVVEEKGAVVGAEKLGVSPFLFPWRPLILPWNRSAVHYHLRRSSWR